MVTFTLAAPNSHSESPFALPTRPRTSWQLPASMTRTALSGYGFTHGTSLPDAARTVINPAPMGAANARVATEQDRPPRGVPH